MWVRPLVLLAVVGLTCAIWAHTNAKRNTIPEGRFRAQDDDEPKALQPSCEHYWKESHNTDKNLTVFKYPSDKEELSNVFCLPVSMIRFSQGQISSHTSSGKPLQYWIDKFLEHGWYKKKNLPDVVKWAEGLYQSVDNRRLYAARIAFLDFVPCRVYNFDEKLPDEYSRRFAIQVRGFGLKRAQYWADAVSYRTAPSVNMPVFGTLDLPDVGTQRPFVRVVSRYVSMNYTPAHQAASDKAFQESVYQ